MEYSSLLRTLSRGRFRRFRSKIGRMVLPDSPSASSTPFVEYAKWLRFTHCTPRAPLSLDIQTQSGCNARCRFCGVGREKNRLHGSMADDLFEKIVHEALGFPRLLKLNLFLLNDPLVDKKLPERLRYVAVRKGLRRFPHVRIATNAGLLTEEIGERLLRSEGLDEIVFSFHSIVPDVYERAMSPLRYDRVMGNILRFRDQWESYDGPKPRLSIWTVRTRQVVQNLRNEKAFWRDVGIPFRARKLDNRAIRDVEDAALTDQEFVRVPICVIPFWRAWIMWNGDMVQCCVDQERRNVLGNCRNREIAEIWRGPRYQALRRQWRTGRLEGLLCNDCKGT